MQASGPIKGFLLLSQLTRQLEKKVGSQRYPTLNPGKLLKHRFDGRLAANSATARSKNVTRQLTQIDFLLQRYLQRIADCLRIEVGTVLNFYNIIGRLDHALSEKKSRDQLLIMTWRPHHHSDALPVHPNFQWLFHRHLVALLHPTAFHAIAVQGHPFIPAMRINLFEILAAVQIGKEKVFTLAYGIGPRDSALLRLVKKALQLPIALFYCRFKNRQHRFTRVDRGKRFPESLGFRHNAGAIIHQLREKALFHERQIDAENNNSLSFAPPEDSQQTANRPETFVIVINANDSVRQFAVFLPRIGRQPEAIGTQGPQFLQLALKKRFSCPVEESLIRPETGGLSSSNENSIQ